MSEEGWQDIETAPKDGTVIDLWVDSGCRITDAYWGEPEVDRNFRDDEEDGWDAAPGWLKNVGFSTYCLGEDERATHWMPLPPPPKAKAP